MQNLKGLCNMSWTLHEENHHPTLKIDRETVAQTVTDSDTNRGVYVTYRQ